MRVAMKWDAHIEPSLTCRKYLEVVWEDKHGHFYYYDPVADNFWHEHRETKRWWLSREGLGR